MQLEFHYDPETDIATIRVVGKNPVDSEHFENEGFVIDYDENDNIIGLEIFDWIKREDISDIISILKKEIFDLGNRNYIPNIVSDLAKYKEIPHNFSLLTH